MSDDLMRDLIKEIKSLHDTIAIMQQDINCIRNGEYDKPSGASPRQPTVTIEEIMAEEDMGKNTL